MRRTTFLLFVVAILAIALPGTAVWAERGDDSKRLSKNGKTEGVIDGVTVTVEYGRPSVKGRKIWGGLVPYDKVWRSGADEATTITFSGDVAVEGQPLAAGAYSLYTIPGENEWTVIFNKVAEQWGSFNYDEAQDALRVTATPTSTEMVEALDFVIEDTDVVLRWEELAVPVTISSGD